ncbi:MAG: SDR family oxidoreductase [bacterium]
MEQAEREQGVVWVTGASSGIGWASALLLARRGWNVAVSARDERKLEKLARRREDLHAYPLDVTDPIAREDVHARIVRDLGSVDVLINNAGYGLRGVVEEVPMHQVRDLFDVNVFAPLALARLVLPDMRRRRRGRIINISSVVGRVAFPISGLYASSKHALEGWTDALRIEVKPWNIHVSLVEPGPIRTKFGRTAKDISRRQLTNSGSPYAPYYRRFLKGGYFSSGMLWSPSTVAWKVLKAVEEPYPSARYPVHWIAHIAPLLASLLPERLMDKLLGRSFGFNEAAEET